MRKFKTFGLAASFAASLFLSTGGQALAAGNYPYCQLLSPPREGQIVPPGVPNLKELLKKTANPDEIVAKMLDPVAPLSAEDLQNIYNEVFEFIQNKYINESKLEHLSQYKNKYDGKLKTRSDLDKAIADLIGSMNDRWTWVVSGSDQVSQMLRYLSKQTGFGISVRINAAGQHEIEHIDFGSAAQLSGFREGDIVLAVGGKTLKGMSKADADKLFAGQVGAALKITSIQDGKTVEKVYTVRESLPNEASAKLLENNIAYLKLPSFMSEKDFAKVVGSMLNLAAGVPGGLQGTVLDLRYNGGGRVDFASSLIQLLLTDGVVIQELSRDGREMSEVKKSLLPFDGAYSKLKFSPEELAVVKELQKLPLVILVNGSSASASEIVTGALMESRKNTTVIGERTFGKFQEMIVFDLPNCSKVAVTSARYTTPSGKWLQDAGINPDITVHQPRDSQEDAQMEAAIKLLKEKTGLNPANVVQMAPESKPILGPAPVRPTPEVDTDWTQLARENRTLMLQGGVGLALLSLLGLYLFLSRRRRDED